MHGISRRRFLKGAALTGGIALAVPLIAACGSTATPTSAPTGASGPAQPAGTDASGENAKPTAAPAANPATSKEVVTLRFHMRAGTEKSEPSMYVTRPAEWSQETGHQVKLEPIPSGQDYVPKLEALIASGTAGDLTWASDFRSEHSHLVRSKALEPVDDYLAAYDVKKSEWFPVLIETMTHDGKMYGMPKAGVPESGFLFVNLTMFDEAGIKRPDVNDATFENVAEWANALAKGPKDRREVYGYWANLRYVGGFTAGVYRRGGDVLDKEGVNSLADTAPWMEWVSWVNKLINEDMVVPLADAVPSGGITSLFASGKIAMFLGQRSDYKPLKEAIKDKFEWMAIQDARGPNSKGAPLSVTTHSGLSSSKHKEVTFTLLKAISDRRYAQLVAEENGYLAGRVDNLEVIGDLAKDPFIQLQHKVSEEAAPMWRAKNLRAYEIETVVVNHLDLLWLGKRQLDKAFMTELKDQMNEVLAKPD